MDTNSQIAADLHLLTAPFRLVGRLIVISLGILAFPLICLLVLLCASRASSDEISLLAVVIAVLGPFASGIWFALTVGMSGYDESPGGGMLSGFAVLGFIVSAVVGGYVFFTQDSANGPVYLCKAVVACFSPSIAFLVLRIFVNKEDAQEVVEIVTGVGLALFGLAVAAFVVSLLYFGGVQALWHALGWA
jgi:hypothetical protein